MKTTQCQSESSRFTIETTDLFHYLTGVSKRFTGSKYIHENQVKSESWYCPFHFRNVLKMASYVNLFCIFRDNVMSKVYSHKTEFRVD